MFFKILIWLFLNHLEQSYANRAYQCDSDRLNELKNLKDHFKRLIVYDDQIYFIFKKRIIYTKLFSIDEQRYLNEDLSQVSFVSHNFFEQLNEEVDLINGIPSDSKVIGHFYNKKKDEIYEFYSTPNSPIYNVSYELDFKQVFASRKQLIESNRIESEFGMESYILKLLDHSKVQYFNILDTNDDKQLIIKFCSSLQDFRIQNNSYQIEFYLSLALITRLFKKNDANLKSFVTYFNERSTDEDNVIYNFLILAITETTNDLELDFTYIHVPLVFDEPNDYSIDFKQFNKNISTNVRTFKSTLNFKELFSCHVKLRNERELKGVFYDSKNGLFFIFINRFYLKIQNDLIQSNYYLNDDDYNRNAFDLKFNNEQIEEQVQFEYLNSKWLYAFEDQTYFRPFNQIFELKTNQNSDLIIEQSNFDRLNKNCFKQTFVIQKMLYCFDRFDYYLIQKDHLIKLDSVKSIFRTTKYSIYELRLIFNYDLNRIVFATSSELFILRYNQFKIESNNKIIYNDENDVLIIQNCINNGESCKIPIPNSSKKHLNNDNYNKNYSNRSYFNYYLASFLIIGLILILFLVYNQIKKKSTKFINEKLTSPISRRLQFAPIKQKQTKPELQKLLISSRTSTRPYSSSTKSIYSNSLKIESNNSNKSIRSNQSFRSNKSKSSTQFNKSIKSTNSFKFNQLKQKNYKKI